MVVVHGAEVTVPGRLPGRARVGARVLRGAAGVVAAGEYPAREAVRAARRPLPGVVVPPGVDVERFRPLDARPSGRDARAASGSTRDRPLVLGREPAGAAQGLRRAHRRGRRARPTCSSRSAARGRDRRRLERARRGGRARGAGAVPRACARRRRSRALYASADVFAMPCRDRWGGLEAEGFGIVFLEAAAAGVPAVAGRSGGSHEAVVDGVTGFVVDGRDASSRPRRDRARLLADDATPRVAMGAAARRARGARVLATTQLAARLAPIAAGDLSGLGLLT